MSQESRGGVSSPSLLNNLRQFRFQKKMAEKLNTANMITYNCPNSASSNSSSSPDVEIVEILPQKKPIPCIEYSDSEDDVIFIDKKEVVVKKEPEAFGKDLATKEINLTFLCEIFPQVDRMVLQDALRSTNWNTAQAMCKINRSIINAKIKKEDCGTAQTTGKLSPGNGSPQNTSASNKILVQAVDKLNQNLDSPHKNRPTNWNTPQDKDKHNQNITSPHKTNAATWDVQQTVTKHNQNIVSPHKTNAANWDMPPTVAKLNQNIVSPHKTNAENWDMPQTVAKLNQNIVSPHKTNAANWDMPQTVTKLNQNIVSPQKNSVTNLSSPQGVNKLNQVTISPLKNSVVSSSIPQAKDKLNQVTISPLKNCVISSSIPQGMDKLNQVNASPQKIIINLNTSQAANNLDQRIDSPQKNSVRNLITVHTVDQINLSIASPPRNSASIQSIASPSRNSAANLNIKEAVNKLVIVSPQENSVTNLITTKTEEKQDLNIGCSQETSATKLIPAQTEDKHNQVIVTPQESSGTNAISPVDEHKEESVESQKRPAEEDVKNGPPHKKVKQNDVDGDKNDDSDGDAMMEENVYDSDDSDQEVTNNLTDDKKRVLEFLSKATLLELRAMPGCTPKKADAIIGQRPFAGWMDLVEKFQTAKYLGPHLLNSAKEVLHIRQDLENLMTKCMKIATQMERAVLAGGSSVKQQPALLSEGLKLTGYQLIGLNWLLIMHAQELNGILADEMGLGKTVQIIAFLAHLKENGMNKKCPHLIVVPSSTLENWNNEFKRWCPSFKVITYYGAFEDRKAMRISWLREGGLDDVDVILTVYNTATSTNEDKKVFRIIELHYVVLDEGHMLKNMSSQRYENLMRINAQQRVLLTGTPVQNNLLELMSLLIFVMPTMFAGKQEQFKRLFSKVPKQVLCESGSDEEKIPQFERQQVEQARRIMKPFVLRRLKVDVIKELPTKTEEIIEITMTDTQKIKYDDLVREFSERAGRADSDMSGMAMMMQLRKMANHPCLLRYYFTDLQVEEMASRLATEPTYKMDNKQFIFEDLAVMSDYHLHQLAESYDECLPEFRLPEALMMESGKFRKLDEIMPKLKEESHRVLIFSQFVIVLDILEEYMESRSHRYLRLDGSTPVTTRQDMIDHYNEDPTIFVFLLSTRAGGMGINLTAADTVIIHDMDFNPYNDKQAEDRCHRVGQTRPVRVIRFVSKGTIEDAIFQAAQEKLNLEREVTGAEGSETTETKNVVCLLKQALALDSNKVANLLAAKEEPL